MKLGNGRHKSMAQPVTPGDGGGAGGGTSTPDSSYTSSDGYTSYSYDSSNYAEVYDPSGNLDSQMYGYDSSGYSYDFVNSGGDDLSFDMPGLPDDISGNTYTFSVEGGNITVEFSSSGDSGKATYQSSDSGKAGSATVGPASTSDINFDGSGQSYHCQLSRLWESTVVASAIMASGLGFVYGPGAAGKAGGGVSAGVIALEQLRVSKEILASQGC
jgi:hypothetical protein